MSRIYFYSNNKKVITLNNINILSTKLNELYNKISHYLNISLNNFYLTYNGILLSNTLKNKNNKLIYYHIQNESFINIKFRLFGGAQLGKAIKGRSNKKKKKDEKQTDEEKSLQDRIKRMEINDLEKKLNQIKRKQLQEYMILEQKNSKMNKLKIQNQWRKIMRLAKVEQLRKDIEILSQSHERDIDRKDAIIQMLDRDLEESEEQYQMTLRYHLQNVDKLIELQDSRLIILENEFQMDLKYIENEFSNEKNKIIKQHNLEKKELLDIMEAVEIEDKEKEAETKQEHEQLREEIRNKNLEDINILRITLDSNIEELEQHFETAHLNYLQNTDQRTQDFKYLTSKDQDLSKDIEIKLRKIERLQHHINQWRLKINHFTKENNDRNRILQEEKDMTQLHYQQLRLYMNKARDNQLKKLSKLAEQAKKTKENLKDKLNMAERILKLAELARKMETEKEKIIPFYTSYLDNNNSNNSINDINDNEMNKLNIETNNKMNKNNKRKENNEMESNKNNDHNNMDKDKSQDNQEVEKEEEEDDNLLKDYQPQGFKTNHSSEAVPEYDYLEKFWKKYNKCLLDQLAMEKDKERMEQENNNLQNILKQYLDGISINDHVMNSSNNSLLMINNNITINQRNKNKNTNYPTIIEAHHTINNNNIRR